MCESRGSNEDLNMHALCEVQEASFFLDSELIYTHIQAMNCRGDDSFSAEFPPGIALSIEMPYFMLAFLTLLFPPWSKYDKVE